MKTRESVVIKGEIANGSTKTINGPNRKPNRGYYNYSHPDRRHLPGMAL